ncbi:aminoglycoside phosphotransferase/kinase family protein [Aporhodopirellula aestuarii]|uniref:Phosphotransferase n=1 Tax=Aporhodopirellula aestuarii TaxID=2950107 RepID=A0ABT0U8Q7_9BACT|nr:phosphotransferase [Aporhodopirellula aestuarii]MCM2373310.1 phosphotransferase [Aporhodopirellula aestuarii]
MFSHDDLLSIASQWLKSSDATSVGSSFRVSPVQSGFSGGHVFRIDEVRDVTPPTAWALKAWPPLISSERMARIAERIVQASQNCELLAPPLPRLNSPSTSVEAIGFRWELARWIAGTPLPADAGDEEIASGGRAIGRIHQAFNDNSLEESSPRLLPSDADNWAPAASPTPQIPRCLTDRMDRLVRLSRIVSPLTQTKLSVDSLATSLASRLGGEKLGDPASDFRCRQLAESLGEAAVWLGRCWNVVVPPLIDRLHTHTRDPEPHPTAWVLRDVHREHILFSSAAEHAPANKVTCGKASFGDCALGGRQVLGVFDYDAVDVDSPAADLARWAGDFGAIDASDLSEIRVPRSSPLEATVAGYRSVCPFSERQFDVAKTLMEVNSVGGLANWLVWLVAENRHFPVTASQIQGRIIHLIASVCRIC